jgi:hypothetical protein
MPWIARPFDYYGTASNQILEDLTQVNDNFEILGSCFVNNDPTTGIAKNADMVDNYHASAIPGPATIPVLDSNAILYLPNTPAIITKHYTIRRIYGNDLTSDYPLARGEEVFYAWDTTASLSRPLYIATSDGIYQMIIVAPYQTGSDIDTYLNPNNTTYSSAFTRANIGYQDGNSGISVATATISNFHLHQITAGGIGVYYLSTYTTSKFCLYIIGGTRYSGGGHIEYVRVRWNNTTTAWTSLGTLTTSAANGTVYILIRRLI